MPKHNRGITVCIGGINLKFFCDPGVAKWEIVRQQYRNFIVNAKPDISIYIKRTRVNCPQKIDNFLAGSQNWVLGREKANWRIYFYQKDFSCSTAVIQPDFKKIVFYTGNNDLVPLMHNLPIFVLILAQQKFNLFILHACGTVDAKKGYLFVADSGGGKSTLARLSSGKTLLNDDRIILRKRGKHFEIFGTPWPGEAKTVSGQSARIKEIFFLQKAQSNRILPLDRIKAMRILLRNIFYFPLGEQQLRRVFCFCHELTRNLRCYQLRFRPDIGIWEKLEKIN